MALAHSTEPPVTVDATTHSLSNTLPELKADTALGTATMALLMLLSTDLLVLELGTAPQRPGERMAHGLHLAHTAHTLESTTEATDGYVRPDCLAFFSFLSYLTLSYSLFSCRLQVLDQQWAA